MPMRTARNFKTVLDEYHKPVVIQDQVLGELTLDKDYDTFKGEIQWCGESSSLSLEGQCRKQALLDRRPQCRQEAAGRLLNLGQSHAGACSKEPDRAGQQLGSPKMKKIPVTRKQTPSQRTVCPADQPDEPVRHLWRELHWLV